MAVPTPPPGGPAGRNAKVLEQLERRRTRLLFWLLGFVLLIPLGCVGPCLLGVATPNQTAQNVLIGAAILLPFVGVGGLMQVAADRSKVRRSLALAEQADALGLAFKDAPSEKAYSRLRELQGVGLPTYHSGANLLWGEVDGTPINILDYSFGHGFGRSRMVYTQTFIFLPGAANGLPDFLLWPTSSLLGRLGKNVGQLLGDRAITFPNDPEFDRRFSLRGEDEEAVAACFTREVRELCRGEGTLVLEVQDGALALYWQNWTATPDECPGLVEEAAQWIEALRRSR